MKRLLTIVMTLIAATVLATAGSTAASAKVPVVAEDHGAYVRVVGNPAEGTVKFQYGWDDGTDASEQAVGYWVGLYDVTNSEYVWSFDTGAVDVPEHLMRNAHPTPDLPSGDYKINFFVRKTYGPATNVAEIEHPFTVTA